MTSQPADEDILIQAARSERGQHRSGASMVGMLGVAAAFGVVGCFLIFVPRLIAMLLPLPVSLLLGGFSLPVFITLGIIALLLYLARSPKRRCTREQLIGLLWPDKDDDAARQSVREAIRVDPELARGYMGLSRVIYAGVFYGWLNSNRAYLAELPEGPGRMLITTFRFEGYGRDPFATMLLDQMLSTAAVKP